MRELILGEVKYLAHREPERKIDVNPSAPFMSEKRKKAAGEQARGR